MAGKHSSVTPTTESSITAAAIKYQWEIEFARFFNFPSSSSSLDVSPLLKPLTKTRIHRSRGSWMSSSSMASLNLISESSNSETILIVFLRGNNLLEEHFTCNLHFSWPQVSCVTQCPIRGSRVVFASYRDSSDQIQKFAMRFATSCDAESFINSVKVQPQPLRVMGKESLPNGLEVGIPYTDLGSEVSSHSEFVSSNGGVQYSRPKEELSLVNHVGSYSPQTQALLNCNYERNGSSRPKEELSLVNHVGSYSPQTQALLNCNYELNGSQEPLFPHDIGGLCLGLPPSFTALLTQCASEMEKEKPMVVPGEVDLKSQISRYMSDSSFHEMLTKVEEVINEIGGDLTL